MKIEKNGIEQEDKSYFTSPKRTFVLSILSCVLCGFSLLGAICFLMSWDFPPAIMGILCLLFPILAFGIGFFALPPYDGRWERRRGFALALVSTLIGFLLLISYSIIFVMTLKRIPIP